MHTNASQGMSGCSISPSGGASLPAAILKRSKAARLPLQACKIRVHLWLDHKWTRIHMDEEALGTNASTTKLVLIRVHSWLKAISKIPFRALRARYRRGK